MQRTNKALMNDISRQMASLVPGILKINVELDKLMDQYVLQAKTTDQRTFSSQALSDGTLRLLALVTLKNDPQFQGTICIEEPENGVDSLHLSQVAHLLQSMATDFSDPDHVDEPLKQVLVTTHSPVFIALPEVVGSVLFAFKVSRVEPGKSTLQVTRMVPVLVADSSGEEEIAAEAYTIDQVRRYLDSGNFDEARERLARARDTSLKGKKQ